MHSMSRLIAHKLVKQKDYSCFKPLENPLTGANITVGNVLVMLVLLGLWQKNDFEYLKKRVERA